jgi:hypothetical protein
MCTQSIYLFVTFEVYHAMLTASVIPQHISFCIIHVHEQEKMISKHRFYRNDQQLYEICGPLAESAIGCVYAFLPSKTQPVYEEMITVVLGRCSELGYQPYPTTIITKFEQAAINAVSSTLGTDKQSKGCFYHLLRVHGVRCSN